MATVINNPDTQESSSAAGIIIAVILAAIFFIVFLIYGLPFLSRSANNNGGTDINVPDQIDVDVNDGNNQ